MTSKGAIWLLSIIISILVLANTSCDDSPTPSIGERSTNTAGDNGPGGGFPPQGDDPLPEIPLPSASEIEEPQQDPNPPNPLLGEFVVFYTWQSDSSFVTKEEFEAFTGIEPPYVWADPNWVSIIIGVMDYAYEQDTRKYDFPVHKYNFGRPLMPYTKDTYCSHLIWQSYCWSTVFYASDPRILALDIDWNGGYIVYPEDLINAKYTREYEYWLR